MFVIYGFPTATFINVLLTKESLRRLHTNNMHINASKRKKVVRVKCGEGNFQEKVIHVYFKR